MQHGAIGMAKNGRKRALVAREANGRAQREREIAPLAAKRLRDAALSGMRDPEWGSELGRLYLNGTITPAMYAAGKRWREQAETYHRSIGVFPVRSASAEPGRGASQPDPDSDEGRRIAKREADGAERFFAAHAALMVDPVAESAVRALCEQNEMPDGFAQLMKLRRGLLALVAHWDLTGTGKSDTADVRYSL